MEGLVKLNPYPLGAGFSLIGQNDMQLAVIKDDINDNIRSLEEQGSQRFQPVCEPAHLRRLDGDAFVGNFQRFYCDFIACGLERGRFDFHREGVADLPYHSRFVLFI